MNVDGNLTHLELVALLRSLDLKPTRDQLHALLANIDANRNGAVEFDELIQAILLDINDEVLLKQVQLLEVFRTFDRDDNNFILIKRERKKSVETNPHVLPFFKTDCMFFLKNQTQYYSIFWP